MNLKDILIPKYDVHLVMNEERLQRDIKGNIPSLLTALSDYVEILKKNGIEEKLIRYAVEQGFKEKKEVTDEELNKKVNELFRKIFKRK